MLLKGIEGTHTKWNDNLVYESNVYFWDVCTIHGYVHIQGTIDRNVNAVFKELEKSPKFIWNLKTRRK
jgi:hypothetical protein